MSTVSKAKNLLEQIRSKVKKGKYIILPHAIQRQSERNISIPDIVYVLNNGWHEERKDEFNSGFQSWNYAIRGITIDEKNLRIAVSFDEKNMLIITVIDLKR